MNPATTLPDQHDRTRSAAGPPVPGGGGRAACAVSSQSGQPSAHCWIFRRPKMAEQARSGPSHRDVSADATRLRGLLRNPKESIYEDSIDAKALSPADAGL